ncbi:stalk domain-containing protein [Brevibacillus centrosporus]|uniref:stalk domain-containing protein n=1 Tax=Brevibacillus centrosporus TaxID=54910 RepID=UPI00398826CB
MSAIKKGAIIVAGIVSVFAGGVVIGSAAPAQQVVQAVKDASLKVTKDGSYLTMRDQNGRVLSPLIYNGVTYLPVRTIGEGLGLTVNYDQQKREVQVNTKQPEGDLRLVDYKGRLGGNVLLSLVDKDLNVADTDFSHGAVIKGNTKLAFSFPEGSYRSFESDIVVVYQDPNNKTKKSSSKKNITLRAFEVVNGKEVAFFSDTYKPMKSSDEGEHVSIRIEGKKEIRIAVEGADGYTKVIFGDAFFRK